MSFFSNRKLLGFLPPQRRILRIQYEKYCPLVNQLEQRSFDLFATRIDIQLFTLYFHDIIYIKFHLNIIKLERILYTFFFRQKFKKCFVIKIFFRVYIYIHYIHFNLYIIYIFRQRHKYIYIYVYKDIQIYIYINTYDGKKNLFLLMPTTRQPHYLDKIKREVTIEKIQEEFLESEVINPSSADLILEKTKRLCFYYMVQRISTISQKHVVPKQKILIKVSNAFKDLV